MLQVGNDCIELLQYVEPSGKPYDRMNCDTGNLHIAFRVPDIEKTYATLKERGVKFNSPPNNIDSGPLKGDVYCYFLDPDGVTLEIYQD